MLLWNHKMYERVKFACDGESEIESEVCVVAS